jgi:glycosyltransferase involved in cell wall biosynthesis
MISILILTFNEEKIIRQCLESVSWSDDVVVVDSFSTDRTVEIARSVGARVIQHEFVSFAEQRNFGLRNGCLKNDWVFHLDADEVVTPQLKDELFKTAEVGCYQGYRVASKLIFQDRWLRYSSMYPCYQVRFGKRDVLGFVQVGHGQRETLASAQIGTLKEPLLHYSFNKGLEDWFARHNRYSTAESAESINLLKTERTPWRGLLARNATARRRALKEVSVRLPCRPVLRFVYMYLLRFGFLDGTAGWRYCYMLALYESMIVLKIKDLLISPNCGESHASATRQSSGTILPAPQLGFSAEPQGESSRLRERD